MEEVKEFKAIPGYGVQGVIQNDDIYFIGNEKLMNEKNIKIENRVDVDNLLNEGNSILFVALNNNMIALIGVKDVLKENVSEVVEKMKQRNIDIVMLTGDNEKTAKAVASQVGINQVVSNVTPKEKAEKIKELKKNGIVIMCGD